MGVPPYKETALPWNSASLPWKDYPTDAGSYTDGQPWNDPRLPWDGGAGDVAGGGGGGNLLPGTLIAGF